MIFLRVELVRGERKVNANTGGPFMDAKIYHLSWNENSFFSKLKLFFRSRKLERRRKIKSGDPYLKAEGYSAISSTYYAIAGTAASKLKSALKTKWLAPFQIVLWLPWPPLALWCYWRMLPLSNRVVELIGYRGMNADQCDERQSILRKRGRYAEAERCIKAGLDKEPEKAHTRGLLHLGMANIHLKRKELINAEVRIGAAIDMAQKSEENDPRQAARIYRDAAKYVKRLAKKKGMRVHNSAYAQLQKKAQELAESVDAQDQLTKMKG